MRDRLMGALIAIALASSLVALAQTNKQGPQTAKAPTASSKPFDAHDLSGFWDITNSGLPAGATLLPRARAILAEIAATAGAVRRTGSESGDGGG